VLRHCHTSQLLGRWVVRLDSLAMGLAWRLRTGSCGWSAVVSAILVYHGSHDSSEREHLPGYTETSISKNAQVSARRLG
jgi:hypothetical protein